MKRLFALPCALACAVILQAGLSASAALAAPSAAAGSGQAVGASSGQATGSGQAAGTVVALGWSTFTIRTGGRQMSIVRALTAAANLVAQGDYPYVYGGGHAQAGTAGIGIRGPGYNGRRVGFDCSGSVGAVLAGAGLLPAGMPVPNDAGIIAELREAQLIAPGVGHGPGAVTFYDKPNVHIFMSIDGHDFGTSDGGAGNPSQHNGGAGWLNDGGPDASSRLFKPYHLVSSALRATTVYGPTQTFGTGRAYDLLQGLAVGDDLQVSYTRDRKDALTATAIAYADAHTVTATITAIASDQSSVTLKTSDGQTLTLGTPDPRLLDWLGVADQVSVTYTPRPDGTPVLRAVALVS